MFILGNKNQCFRLSLSRTVAALEGLKLKIEQYPKSANTNDRCGDALFIKGDLNRKASEFD
jgi:hypothetical protein